MTADLSRQQRYRRYRRRILGWGAAALLVVFALGSVVTMPRVHSELELLVDSAAVDAGATGVTSSFSGQDGTLTCAPGAVVDDAVVSELSDLRGVRTLTVDASCRDADDATVGEVADSPSNTGVDTPITDPPDSVSRETEATDGPADDDGDGVTESVLDVVRNDSQFSALADLIDDADLGGELGGDETITLFAPTNDALQALGPDTIAAMERDPDLLGAVLRHHIAPGELTGDDFTSGDIEMLDGTTVSISPGEAPIDTALVSGDGTANLTQIDIPATNGVVHAVDAVLLPPGFELPVADPDPDPEPEPDPTTTSIPEPVEEDDETAAAAQLEGELNAFVADNPILFEQGSAVIADTSQPVLDQIVTLVTQLAVTQLTDIDIEVQGHTDTDGNPERNQVLSEDRAAAVRDALIAAGVEADSVTSVGFGGTRTIVDAAGVEDKAASRRVEFVVTAA